jgi:hypothetical protein
MATGTEQQDPMKAATPQKEHNWLEKLVGEWTFEGEAVMAPGEAPHKFSGVEKVRSLGGLWFIAEGQHDSTDGGPATSIMSVGYDPARGRYVGTWIGSMMPNMWVYDGELDDTERALSLFTEGPSMTGDGKTARYKEVIEFRSGDERSFTSHVQGADGGWQQLLTMTYRRRK